MDDVSFSKKANISVINRFDQQVKDIIISASQVALYVFEPKKAKWIKRKVEGACFFYKRKTSPRYGIFILNRLDTTNFIELMNSTMDIQLQEPYILYRNIFKTIYGIWFYEKSECTAMAAVFQRILEELKEKEKDEDDDDDPNALMKDKACTADITEHNGVENIAKPNGQPDSVRQFFAKASKEATKSQPLTPQQPSCSKSLCNSFQSVAHIEKAQKSDTHDTFRQLVFGASPSRKPVTKLDHRAERFKKEECEMNVNIIENSMKSINLDPSVQELEKFPQNFLLKDDFSNSSTEFPELIPPGMLLTPDLSASIKTDVVPDIEKIHVKKVLSKKEMIDAMEYLLKNDAQFTDKLYDAYLRTKTK